MHGFPTRHQLVSSMSLLRLFHLNGAQVPGLDHSTSFGQEIPTEKTKKEPAKGPSFTNLSAFFLTPSHTILLHCGCWSRKASPSSRLDEPRLLATNSAAFPANPGQPSSMCVPHRCVCCVCRSCGVRSVVCFAFMGCPAALSVRPCARDSSCVSCTRVWHMRIHVFCGRAPGLLLFHNYGTTIRDVFFVLFSCFSRHFASRMSWAP